MWKSILVNKSWNFHQFLLIPILIKFLGMGLFFYTTKACSAASLFVANMTIADLCVSVLISSGPVLMKKKLTLRCRMPVWELSQIDTRPNWDTPHWTLFLIFFEPLRVLLDFDFGICIFHIEPLKFVMAIVSMIMVTLMAVDRCLVREILKQNEKRMNFRKFKI